MSFLLRTSYSSEELDPGLYMNRSWVGQSDSVMPSGKITLRLLMRLVYVKR